MKLQGKVAIITGAAGGIGSATAAACLKEGARVVLHDLDQRRAEETATALRRQGYENILPIAGDVADRTDCLALVQQTLSQWRQIDILINNAGVSAIANSEDLTAELWQRTLDVNLSGCFYCTQAVAKLAMLPQKSGNIIMISSILGIVGLHRRAAYCATKAGLIGLTKALATEWASDGIRVNALCPGYILTPMEEQDAANTLSDYTKEDIKRRTPMGRYGTPEEVAAACTWLASDESSYCTGSVLLSDGGWTAYGGW